MIGTRLGTWVVEKELGRGGMGRVYLAHEEPTDGAEGRTAAVKVLAAELAQESGFLQRFQREIEVLAKLDHPNIVRFYEAGNEAGTYYYAMEYVSGRTFEEVLQERGRLPWKEVLDVALQVCGALRHAHNHGFIHRDLKPPNLMQGDDGVVKLTDFGIAKVFASKQLTATGALVGTAEFLSPEQAGGKPVTERSDLYSFGVVLYTLLTGRTPFEGQSILDLLHKHRFAQFDPPRKVVTDLPYELDELVCNLLEKDPSARPANAMVLQRRLESISRQLERKAQRTAAVTPDDVTHVENIEFEPESEGLPGPATLMSQLVREELESQQRGNWLTQLFNRPWVVAPLFVVCVALITWKVWPAHREGAQKLFDLGAPLMEGNDPDEWIKGWTNYLEPLERDYPNHPHGEAIKKYRQKYTEAQALHRALGSARPASQAQLLYRKGLQRLQEGDSLAALTEWRTVVREYEAAGAQREWVDLAKKGLAVETSKILARARELRDEGEQKDAEQIWKRIEALYPDDPATLDEVRKDRGR